MDILKMSVQRATKLLKLQPCKTQVVHALKDTLYKINPLALEELRNHICHKISTTPMDELRELTTACSTVI